MGVSYSEGELCFDIFVQCISDGAIESAEDLHGQLRLDALAANQVIESIGQSAADAAGGLVSGLLWVVIIVPAIPVELVDIWVRHLEWSRRQRLGGRKLVKY